MKKLILLLISSIMLVACNTDGANVTNEEIEIDSSQTESNGSDSLEEDDLSEIEFNGYEPRDELEQMYFDAINKYSNWKSYELYTTYYEDFKGEDEVPGEISVFYRFVLNPYQLHETYHSLFYRNDFREVYATADIGYENPQYTFWKKLDDNDHAIYVKDLIPARAELYYALIAHSDGVVEDGDKIAFNIEEQYWDDMYKKIQLAYFYNLDDEGKLSTDGMENISEPLNGLEGIYVVMSLKDYELHKIDITVSFNRVDPETVDQLLFSDEYSEINAFDSIEIPSEVLEESDDTHE